MTRTDALLTGLLITIPLLFGVGIMGAFMMLGEAGDDGGSPTRFYIAPPTAPGIASTTSTTTSTIYGERVIPHPSSSSIRATSTLEGMENHPRDPTPRRRGGPTEAPITSTTIFKTLQAPPSSTSTIPKAASGDWQLLAGGDGGCEEWTYSIDDGNVTFCASCNSSNQFLYVNDSNGSTLVCYDNTWRNASWFTALDGDTIYYSFDGKLENNTLTGNTVHRSCEGYFNWSGDFRCPFNQWCPTNLTHLRDATEEYTFIIASNDTVSFDARVVRNISHEGAAIIENYVGSRVCNGNQSANNFGLINGTPGGGWVWCNDSICLEDMGFPLEECYWKHGFDNYSYDASNDVLTIYYSDTHIVGYEEDYYRDWSPVRNFHYTEKQGLHLYMKNFSFEANETIEFALKFHPNYMRLGVVEQKYNYFIKFANESLAYARNHDRYCSLDPWGESDCGFGIPVNFTEESGVTRINYPRYYNFTGLSCIDGDGFYLYNQTPSGGGGVSYPIRLVNHDCTQAAESDYAAIMGLLNITASETEEYTLYYNCSSTGVLSEWGLRYYTDFNESTVQDKSGYDNPMEQRGDPVMVGGYGEFADGTITLDGSGDFLNITDSDSLDTPEYCVIMTFNPTGIYDADFLWAKCEDYNEEQSYGVFYENSNNAFYHRYTTDGSTTNLDSIVGAGLWDLVGAPDTYHTYASCHDNTHTKVYLDGYLNGSQERAGYAYTGVGPLFIGARYDNDGSPYHAGASQMTIDEFMVFNSSLSLEIIQGINASTKPAITVGDEETATTTTTSTSTSTTSIPLTEPELVSPANTTSTTDSTPFMDWLGCVAQGVISYTIQIDEADDFAEPIYDVDIETTTYYQTDVAFNESLLYWRVNCSNTSYSSAWSEVWEFTYNATAACDDGVKNGDEEGIDCGGSCPKACEEAWDYILAGDGFTAADTHCFNGVQDSRLGETDIDCGGMNTTKKYRCAPCAIGASCYANYDCIDGAYCHGDQTCHNITEIGNCSNGRRDSTLGETDIDCGGPCARCTDGKQCRIDEDCALNYECVNQRCVRSEWTSTKPGEASSIQLLTVKKKDCGGGKSGRILMQREDLDFCVDDYHQSNSSASLHLDQVYLDFTNLFNDSFIAYLESTANQNAQMWIDVKFYRHSVLNGTDQRTQVVCNNVVEHVADECVPEQMILKEVWELPGYGYDFPDIDLYCADMDFCADFIYELTFEFYVASTVEDLYDDSVQLLGIARAWFYPNASTTTYTFPGGSYLFEARPNFLDVEVGDYTLLGRSCGAIPPNEVLIEYREVTFTNDELARLRTAGVFEDDADANYYYNLFKIVDDEPRQIYASDELGFLPYYVNAPLCPGEEYLSRVVVNYFDPNHGGVFGTGFFRDRTNIFYDYQFKYGVEYCASEDYTGTLCRVIADGDRQVVDPVVREQVAGDKCITPLALMGHMERICYVYEMQWYEVPYYGTQNMMVWIWPKWPSAYAEEDFSITDPDTWILSFMAFAQALLMILLQYFIVYLSLFYFLNIANYALKTDILPNSRLLFYALILTFIVALVFQIPAYDFWTMRWLL